MLSVGNTEDLYRENEKRNQEALWRKEEEIHIKRMKVIKEVINEIISKSKTRTSLGGYHWASIDGKEFVAWNVTDRGWQSDHNISLLSDGRLTIYSDFDNKPEVVLELNSPLGRYGFEEEICRGLVDIAENNFGIKFQSHWTYPYVVIPVKKKSLFKSLFGKY